jgi:hypothetical protein
MNLKSVKTTCLGRSESILLRMRALSSESEPEMSEIYLLSMLCVVNLQLDK